MSSASFAQETVKQIITISTAVSTFTITFADKFRASGAELVVPWSLGASWVLFALAILGGILTLMALTGNLASLPDAEQTRAAYRPNVRICAGLMMVFFFLGIAATIWAGFTIVRFG